MQYTRFGKTGFCVSRLGIGSIGVGPTPEEQAEVVRLMNRLLDAGCNLVDTAQIYARSEALIGQHLSHRRDEFFLVSKCGHHDVLSDGSMRSRAISMEDIDMALRKLRTDHLDAMLLHSYDYDLLQQGDALAVLEKARAAGKIRFAGYSGDNERAQYAAEHTLIDVVEMSVNLCDWHNVDKALPATRMNDVAVIAKRPLANACWRLVDDPSQANEHVRPYVDRFIAMQLPADLPAELGCSSWGELALRLTLSQPGVHCAIASSRSEANQDANMAAATKGSLEPVALDRLKQVYDKAKQGEEWQSLN